LFKCTCVPPSAGPGVWKRSRRPVVGSGRGRAHACTAGPGVCTVLCQTLSSHLGRAVGGTGARARQSRRLPTIPHSPVFCSMGCFERLLDPLTLSLLCARLVSLALGLVFVNARCCANPIARRLVVPAPFPLSRLPSRPCVSRAREARARGLLALILSCSAGRPPRRAWHGKARSHAPDFSL